MITDDKFCMKHLIFLILLALVSCSGEMGADSSNNNSNRNGNGGSNIFDDIIPDANAGVMQDEGGCKDGFSKVTVYSNIESYYSCIMNNPITNPNLRIDSYGYDDYYIYSENSFMCYRQYGLDTCKWDQLKSASIQGVINLNNTPFIADNIRPYVAKDHRPGVAFLSDTDNSGWDNWKTTKSTITSAQEYCCYR